MVRRRLVLVFAVLVALGVAALFVPIDGLLQSGAVGGGATTPFATFGASFAIQGGVARTGDLKMAGPAIELSGSGSANLSNHQINFHFVPRANLGVVGLKLADIGIPFIATGTWDNPSFAPDAAALPQSVVGAVAGSVTGTVEGTTSSILGVPADALKSLFGK